MKMRRWIGGLVLATAGLMAVPVAAPAQVLDRGIQITGSIGPYVALGKLGNITEQRVPVGETVVENGFAIGGNVEVPIPVERLSVRAGLNLVPSAEIETLTFFGCPLESAFTQYENACRATSDGTLLTGSTELVYRTEQDFTRPHGVFSIGFGLKRYSFDEEPTMHGLPSDDPVTGPCRSGDRVCEFHESFTGSTTDPTLHLGFGLSTSVGGVNLMGEVADYISVFSHESEGRELEELVHDIFLKVSAGVRIL